jgi:hypothetical protein
MLVSSSRVEHAKGSWQLLEERNQFLFLDLFALESLSLIYPYLMEFCEMLTKNLDRVVVVHIEHFELLDND